MEERLVKLALGWMGAAWQNVVPGGRYVVPGLVPVPAIRARRCHSIGVTEVGIPCTSAFTTEPVYVGVSQGIQLYIKNDPMA